MFSLKYRYPFLSIIAPYQERVAGKINDLKIGVDFFEENNGLT
jgi:hypothetical protein